MYRVNIYTMTDIKGPRRRDGIYAYLLEVPTDKGPATCQVFKEIKDATENRAELTAVVEALKRLNQSCDLDIYTDSEHIATAINNNWLVKWRDNGWMNAKGSEISNRDLVAPDEIKAVLKKISELVGYGKIDQAVIKLGGVTYTVKEKKFKVSVEKRTVETTGIIL